MYIVTAGYCGIFCTCWMFNYFIINTISEILVKEEGERNRIRNESEQW